MDNNKQLLQRGVANLIRSLRTKTGWTLKYLSERLDYSESYLSLIERSKKTISTELLLRFCKLLNLTFSDLALYLDVYALEKRSGVIISITERLIAQIKD